MGRNPKLPVIVHGQQASLESSELWVPHLSGKCIFHQISVKGSSSFEILWFTFSTWTFIKSYFIFLDICLSQNTVSRGDLSTLLGRMGRPKVMNSSGRGATERSLVSHSPGTQGQNPRWPWRGASGRPTQEHGFNCPLEHRPTDGRFGKQTAPRKSRGNDLPFKGTSSA